MDEKIRASLSAPSDREGIAVNLDLGTILENKESLEMLPAQLPLIRHIHLALWKMWRGIPPHKQPSFGKIPEQAQGLRLPVPSCFLVIYFSIPFEC